MNLNEHPHKKITTAIYSILNILPTNRHCLALEYGYAERHGRAHRQNNLTGGAHRNSFAPFTKKKMVQINKINIFYLAEWKKEILFKCKSHSQIYTQSIWRKKSCFFMVFPYFHGVLKHLRCFRFNTINRHNRLSPSV